MSGVLRRVEGACFGILVVLAGTSFCDPDPLAAASTIAYRVNAGGRL
jgi:hypothetical protein